MDSKKLPYQLESGAVVTTMGEGVPTSTYPSGLTSSRSKTSPWGPLYVIGVFGCAFLLFHLYLTTSFHHAFMDHGLRRLEKEIHEVMELQLVRSNATAAAVVNPVTEDANDRIVPGTQRLPYGGLEELHGDSHRARKRHWGARLSRRSDPAIAKRGGATFTWFHPGQGACGGFNGDNDFIVAISHLIWNNGAHCGDTISITYHGKVVQATVVDECMGCDPGHIDLSPGLLRHIVGAGKDMITDGAWTFGGASPPKEEEKPKPKPTTSHYTTSREHSTTTQTSTKLSSTSSTQTTSTSSAVSTYALPTPIPEIDGVQNLESFGELVINIAGVAMAGALAENA